MTILTWCLYLIVTLLILVPFVLFFSACVFELYFKNKAVYVSKMVGLFGKALMEYGEELKKASAMVNKEKENG